MKSMGRTRSCGRQHHSILPSGTIIRTIPFEETPNFIRDRGCGDKQDVGLQSLRLCIGRHDNSVLQWKAFLFSLPSECSLKHVYVRHQIDRLLKKLARLLYM